MRARTRRLRLVALSAVLLIGATALTLYALSNQVDAFLMPADVVEKGGALPGERARIGGLVKMGSLQQLPEGGITFVAEDTIGELTVKYDGFIPDLFREGQGIVANGTFTEAYTFEASELLAKHDETYMPKEVEDALKEQGVYRGDEGV